MELSKKNLIFFVAVIWLSHFMVDLMIGIWSVHKTLANLDLAIAGMIGALCAFIGEGLQFFFGSLSDKGHRKTLLIAGIIASSASAWLAYTDHFFILFLLYLLTCIGSSAFHPAAASALGDIGKRQGLLMGLFTSGGALGMALSHILYRKSHLWFNGNIYWLSLPILGLVFTGTLFKFQNQNNVSNTSSIHSGSIKKFIHFFRQREFQLLYICQVSIASILWGTMFLLPDLLLSREYDPWIALGGGHMVYILSGAIMMVPAGYLADRYSSRTVIFWASIFGAFFFYFFLSQPYLENHTLLLLLFSTGALLGIINPIAVALSTRLAPNQKGTAGAFSMGLVWCVSEGIGLGIGGFLATCFTDDAPAKALSILGSLFLVAILSSFFLPRKETALEAMETA